MAGVQALRPVGAELAPMAIRTDRLDQLRRRVGADILRVLRLSGAIQIPVGNETQERERALDVLGRWELSTVPLFFVNGNAALTDFSARDVAAVLQIAHTTRGDRRDEHAVLVVHRRRLMPILVEGDVVDAGQEEATIEGQAAQVLYFVRNTVGPVLSAASGGTTVYEAHPASVARAPDILSAIVDDRGARAVTSPGRVDTVVVRVATSTGEVVLRAAAVASSATPEAATVYAAKAVAVRTNLALTVRALLHAFVPDPRDPVLENAQAQVPLAAALVPVDADTRGMSAGLGFAFGGRRDTVTLDVSGGWLQRVRASSPGALAAAARLLQYPVAGLVLGVHVANAAIGRSSHTASRERQHAAGLERAREVVYAYAGVVFARANELAELGVGSGLAPWIGLYSVAGGAAGAAGILGMEMEARAATTTEPELVVSEVAIAPAAVEVTAAPGETMAVGEGTTAVDAVAIVAHDAVVTATETGFVVEAAGEQDAQVAVTTADGAVVDVVVPAGSALVGEGDGAVAVEAGGERVEVKLEPGVVAEAAQGGGAVETATEQAAVGNVQVKTEVPEAPPLVPAFAIPEAPPAPVFRRPRGVPTRAELADILGELRQLTSVTDAGTLRIAVIVLAERAAELEAALRACQRR